MKNLLNTEKVCYIYVILGVLYTLFSFAHPLWYAFNYTLQYAFIAYLAYRLIPKLLISKLIICMSISRCIVNVYAIFSPEMLKSQAVCSFLIISLAIFALWITFSRQY